MNPKYLDKMSAKELDSYGKCVGVDVRNLKTKEQKAEAIRAERERTVQVVALGIPFEVKKSAVRDKRVTDVFEDPRTAPDDVAKVMDTVLGNEQYAELVNACTDEDGSVDVDAMTYATVAIINSAQVKNLRG